MKNRLYLGILFSIYFILGYCIFFIMDIGPIPKIVLFFVLVFTVDPIKKKLKDKGLNHKLKLNRSNFKTME